MLHGSHPQREWGRVPSQHRNNTSRSYSSHEILVGSSKTGDLLHCAQPELKQQQYITKLICAQKPELIACKVLKP